MNTQNTHTTDTTVTVSYGCALERETHPLYRFYAECHGWTLQTDTLQMVLNHGWTFQWKSINHTVHLNTNIYLKTSCSMYQTLCHKHIQPWPNKVGVGWLYCPSITWEPTRAHMRLIRKCLSTVIWARWATVVWLWPKEWNWCIWADSTFKKKKSAGGKWLNLSNLSFKSSDARKRPPQPTTNHFNTSSLLSCRLHRLASIFNWIFFYMKAKSTNVQHNNVSWSQKNTSILIKQREAYLVGCQGRQKHCRSPVVCRCCWCEQMVPDRNTVRPFLFGWSSGQAQSLGHTKEMKNLTDERKLFKFNIQVHSR